MSPGCQHRYCTAPPSPTGAGRTARDGARDHARIEVCDRVNVLQYGQITLDRRTAESSVEELTELMVAEYQARRSARPPRPGGELGER